jgi:CheY-like chemotaxis protein/anti-sigma regulatory factor (Ser/Thr protein kinase)
LHGLRGIDIIEEDTGREGLKSSIGDSVKAVAVQTRRKNRRATAPGRQVAHLYDDVAPLRSNGLTKEYSVLVVDDEPAICSLLSDYFTVRGHRTRQAANGVEALERIAEQLPDAVISDIRMPVMDGIELFRIIKDRYPSIKDILMTGYNVDEYLALIRRHNIGNIMVKGPSFNLAEVGNHLQSILTGDVFGLERHFSGQPVHRVAIDSYARSREVCAMVAQQCLGRPDVYLQMAVDELIANAVFHGVLEMTGVSREQWRDDTAVNAANAITVTWAKDAEKIGVAVEDPKGNLKKVDALRWLDQDDRSGREVEEHGRGLYLVRRLIDRFIINIDPGKRTECIVIQYFNQDHLHNFKPLQINEV